MARSNLAHKDASSHAASELEYVIKKRKSVGADTAPQIPTSTPQEAMSGERIVATDTGRDVTRVLFISQNTELLNPTQQSLDGYLNLSDLFDEVHILILRAGIPPRQPVIRVQDNVFIYTAAAQVWWLKPSAGLEMAEDQLVFANGFRADLIVARDPHESAWIAWRLSARFGTPTQLHITENLAKADFWHRLMARFLLPKFESVRTLTERQQKHISHKFNLRDVATLPRFQNYEAIIDMPSSLDLKKKYQPMVFFMLFVGKLTHKSTLHQVLTAARVFLKNVRVGLVVIGAGTARGEFMKRTKTLEIEQQVVFEQPMDDIVPYLKSANVLLVTDTDDASERVVLQGAAAGIPMILGKTEQREDLFTHGESAFLCDPDDAQAVSNHINELLNNIGLRQQFAQATQDMIREKFHPDPTNYRAAYRRSIEQALLLEEQVAKDAELATEATA